MLLLFLCPNMRMGGMRTMKEKREIRCAACNRMLATTNGDTDIVCRRCGGLNQYNAETGKIVYIPKSQRDMIGRH